MKVTHLEVKYCVVRVEATNEEKLICMYQKCWTIRGIQCEICYFMNSNSEYTLMLSYFSSLNYCYLYLGHQSSPTIVQD